MAVDSVNGTHGAGRLEVSGVRKSFGSLEVLKGIDLTIEPGEFVTLLGPSGCGKTTLLRIIAGLEVADAGSVRLAGVDLLGLPAQRRPVNTVFQHYALFPHLRIADNVAFGLRARRVPAVEVTRRVGEALALLQLSELASRYPHQLSGGQKQRVAVARALVNEPLVLLLDEPLSALDAKLRGQVQIELRRLQRRLGKSFILVTHDQDEALTVSDRILVMREGLIEQVGTPREVYDRPCSRFVAGFLGAANLLEARQEGSGPQVQTNLGRLTLAGTPRWAQGHLCIRPEGIEIFRSRPERAENLFEATLEECIYRGDHLEAFLAPAGLRVRTTALSDLQAGAKVWIHLPPERLRILDD